MERLMSTKQDPLSWLMHGIKWRPVLGYEGKYEASAAGEIRSVERDIAMGYGHRGTTHIPQRILRAIYRKRDNGNASINLTTDVRRADGIGILQRRQCVGRLVWEAFHGPVPKGYVIKCMNGNKEDCWIYNLGPISRRELLARNTGRTFKRTHDEQEVYDRYMNERI